MTLNTIRSAGELVEGEVEYDAPLYALTSNPNILEISNRDLVGRAKTIRFPPELIEKTVHDDLGAIWKPLPVDANLEGWILGKLSVPQDRLHEIYFEFSMSDQAVDILPDIFVMGDLIVSERAKAFLLDAAPDFCKFTPARLTRKSDGRPLGKTFFTVLVNHSFHYKGPKPQQIFIRKTDEYAVSDQAWSAFCLSEHAQAVAYSLPLFTFNRNYLRPCLNQDLFVRLKAEGFSGLIELDPSGTSRAVSDPLRGWETVVPLDPSTSKAI